ncbi:MAG: DNA-processing protein DprA [Candidatus Xenobia bacterium]
MEDLYWWGLNQAALGLTRELVERLDGLDGEAAWKLDAAGWVERGLAEDVAQRLMRAHRKVDLAGQAAAAKRAGVHFIGWRHAEYPEVLRHLQQPPLALSVLGQVGLLAQPAIAVVGARRASSYGREVAWSYGHTCGLAKVCVVSGMARGIDATAHRAALQADGPTVAVLGCGVDVCYPAEERSLYEMLAVRGAVVSELALGAPPHPGHFPFRNRIIAALSRAVVVVEGTMRSGSLHTVDYALALGREVFAVPGSVFAEGAQLPHRLLTMGATPALGPGELMQRLGMLPTRRAEAGPEALPDPEGPLLAALAKGSKTADQLAEECRLAVPALLAGLLSLEIRGLARRLPGSRYVRV